MTQTSQYDAILYHSFGGPEGMDEVMPFLQRVTAGRRIPAERLAAVATHYEARGGVSPINAQNRDIIARLETVLINRGIELPIIFANRNSAPFLPDVLAALQQSGARRVLQFVTAGYSCYSGCRQYREDVTAALAAQEYDLQVDKIRVFHNHPRYIAAQRAILVAALDAVRTLTAERPVLLCTAHSIPTVMADHSAYVSQLTTSAATISAGLPLADVRVVYQSRSGSPQQPWLEPDIADALDAVAAAGHRAVIVAPIGFVSDHMEVINDLDEEAAKHATACGLVFRRAATVASHPEFIEMIADLIVERLENHSERPSCGSLAANPDRCATDCCLRGQP